MKPTLLKLNLRFTFSSYRGVIFVVGFGISYLIIPKMHRIGNAIPRGAAGAMTLSFFIVAVETNKIRKSLTQEDVEQHNSFRVTRYERMAKKVTGITSISA